MSGSRVINERETEFAHVALCYHGLDARPKLTLRVEFAAAGRGAIEAAIPEERAMEAFNHPFAYLATAAAEI